ncbi:hypothetical protein CEXT_92721 [Caerostris extrusa]|uniref:Uncharacterized protein n=1 Tax=Caerostris extrusa TaxID=172846 RepID=A0AAV4Y716_CAEEX|nr:hypothetical protein CEXT_92721 [Caerostris extrusa]
MEAAGTAGKGTSLRCAENCDYRSEAERPGNLPFTFGIFRTAGEVQTALRSTLPKLHYGQHFPNYTLFFNIYPNYTMVNIYPNIYTMVNITQTTLWSTFTQTTL